MQTQNAPISGFAHKPKTLTITRLGLLFLSLGWTLVSEAALPAGWLEADIGSPGLLGSTTYSNGTWTINGGGADICTSDQSHFVWKPLSGDAIITAQVLNVANSSSAQAGVTLRNDLTQGTPEVSVLATTNTGVTFQWRSAAGGGCSYQVAVGLQNLTVPVWVQLVRSGNNFSGYLSTNGVDFIQIGSTQTVPLNLATLGGLMVCAGNNSTVSAATFSNVSIPQPVFGLYRELWSGLSPAAGNSLVALTNTTDNHNWPNSPDTNFTAIYPAFETETNTGMNYYGQRLRAFIIPPMTGPYTFWIASDDTSQLSLSTDEQPANAVPIAWVNTLTNPRQWTRETNQQSAPVTLQAGHRYFIQGLMQQGTGSDNLAVRWQLPTGTNEEPIGAVSPAGTWMVPFTGIDTLPGIYQQPTNLTVSDGLDAAFTLLITNPAPVTYQWLRNGTIVTGPNATSPVYLITHANPTNDNNQIYSCIVSSSSGSITSAPAVLTVIADITRPTVVRTLYENPTNVLIAFSEPIEPSSATNVANYAFADGLLVLAASLGFDNQSVTLTTPPLAPGSNFILVLNGIRDRATTPNTIATNTLVTFFASPYTPQGIGNPAPVGTIVGDGNGYDVGGGGKNISGASDQFQFVWQPVNGNFDIAVRLDSFSQTDPFAQAGLMAREDLSPASRFAAVLATPSMNGTYFETRSAIGGNTSSSGNLRVNYPNTWLRLQRVSNLFTGYASYDGTTWQQLGSSSLVLTNTLFLGMAVCSHKASQAAEAQFRDFTQVSNAVLGSVSIPYEPLGPCSRLTPFVISEIMYKPAPRTDGNNVEFIELYNSNPYFEDLSGFQIAGGSISYTFPKGTLLAGGAFLVLAASPAGIQNVYGITNVMGPYSGGLKKSGTIELIDAQGGIVLTIPYSDLYPWPVAGHGTGHSIFLANPTYGEGDPRAWQISDVVGGSPGQGEAFRPDPLRSVVINEVFAHSENPSVLQFIELYNHSAQTSDLSGCVLTDDTATNKFVIPQGTLIGPGGFVAFNQSQLGFSLDGSGAMVFFIKPDGSRILDAVQYLAEADGVSFGRWPDGASDFYPLTVRTPAAANSGIWIGDIVINEIMYAPISGSDDDQYIELYNKGTNSVSLANWQFTAGISFIIPQNVTLAPNGYLVIARNQTNLFGKYANLNAANTLGNYGGKLSHKGERLALAMPQILTVRNGATVSTNTILVVEDEVTFGSGGRWGQWAHAGGSSLELINPNTNHRLAYNWADSDETTKSIWTNLEFTGVLDNGGSYSGSPVNLVQVGLMDVGECLVDNIEVRPGGPAGTNIVSNGTFETGLSPWVIQGDHMRSSLETTLGGYQSPTCLHLRSSDGIWTLGDYAQGVLTQTTLGAGQTATLRLKARWLRGWPEILMRVRGNWIEVAGAMPLPPNLGTPGLPNSRAVANPGPAIYEIAHSPALPAANRPVVVTARFHDLNSFKPTLLYRLDTGVNPAPAYTAVTMVDDGTGGDALAGDGIYSATIPGQASGSVVPFLVQARDSSGVTTVFPQVLNNNAGIPRECVVGFGDTIPIGSFSHHHVFITQNWAQRWAQGGGVSHEVYDGTWVDGGGRIVYNWMGRYAGSPYHQYLGSPVTTIGGMHWLMPDDDQVFGTASFNKQHVPGNGPLDDNTLQREQACYWIARQIGLHFQNRRYYFYFVNGVRHAPLMEDSQVPDAQMLKEIWPNDNNGMLYKNHSWFEGDVAPQSNAYMNFNNLSWCYLGRYTTTINGVPNQYKAARYRWMWWVRQYQQSANDFSQLYALIDAANTPNSTPAYYANIENQVDTEEWLRLSAMEHATGDWDSFFTQNQWNMYCYKPTMGKWTALKWDWNISLGGGTSTWPSDGSQLFNFNSNDPVFSAFQNYPAYLRAYLRALQDIANLGMNNALINSMLDAKYAAFAANGLTTSSYNGLTVLDPGAAGLKSWIGTMHNSILTALVNRGVSNVPFTITSEITNNNVLVVSGTAPLQVKTIWFNGVEYPVTWPTLSGWTASVPLSLGTNQFTVLGVDLHSQPVAGSSNVLSVVYDGPPPSAVGQVVLNEIMYNPAIADASYIELFNNSPSFAFDLSGWQIEGAGYTFPAGSLINPNSYVVVASNPSAFSSAYGGSVPTLNTFFSPISPSGQNLFLTQPAAPPSSNVVVAAVRYGSAAPWPAAATSVGSSLQLIDPHQDNWRVGNWATVLTNGPASTPQWQYVTLTGIAPKPILLVCMHGTAGDVYIDDMKLVAGSVPEVGANLIQDGDFESALSGSWTLSSNMTSSIISTAIKHSGTASLHVIATTPGDTIGQAIWENTAPIVTNGTYTLSYWYLPSTNGTQLLIRLSGSGPGSGQVYSLQDIQPPSTASAQFTPGAANSVVSSLPPFPPLWLNELQADNLTGITNRAGQHAPWVELYNPTTNAVSLSGLYLSTNYADLTAWAFPPATSINPGEFMVIFADAQTSLSTANELHTSFTLSSGSGSLALSRLYNGQPQVLDYIDYSQIAPNHSFGSVPDGQSFFREELAFTTPGGTNDATNPASFIAYTSPGSIYKQNFDILPDPGATSVNTANPVTINGITYSLANPFSFFGPIVAAGNSGGLGISELAGWYGQAALTSKFGASDGDQTTGGLISFGLPNSSNRALGLLATSSTGGTAFGAKFINETAQTLNSINIQVTGELWRQSNVPKSLECYYFIDPTASAPFTSSQTALLPGLNVNLPVDPAAVGGVAVDGTASISQTNLSLVNQAIANWQPGAALWLVWQMTDSAGKAQGLAIDNLSFSASSSSTPAPVPLNFVASATNLVISWTSVLGQTYQVEYKDDLKAGVWTPLGSPITGTGGTLTFTADFTQSTQRFYHFRVAP